jgi:hypothetical protein
MKKLPLVTLIFASAGLVWWTQNASWKANEKALQQSRERLESLRERAQAAEMAVSKASAEQNSQNQIRLATSTSLRAAQRDLAAKDPASQWAEPPAHWPEWNPNSPYIWVRKESLPSFRPAVFTQSGGISREAADVLAIDDSLRNSINAQLQTALSNYRAAELTNAEVTTKPSKDNASISEITVKIPPPADEGAVFQNTVTQILQQNLGDQRAGLITNAASSWLSGFSSGNQTAITVSRLGGGNYQLSMEMPNGSSSSYGGLPGSNVQMILPSYVLPLFNDFFAQSPDQP